MIRAILLVVTVITSLSFLTTCRNTPTQNLKDKQAEEGSRAKERTRLLDEKFELVKQSRGETLARWMDQGRDAIYSDSVILEDLRILNDLRKEMYFEPTFDSRKTFILRSMMAEDLIFLFSIASRAESVYPIHNMLESAKIHNFDLNEIGVSVEKVREHSLIIGRNGIELEIDGLLNGDISSESKIKQIVVSLYFIGSELARIEAARTPIPPTP